MKNNRILEFEAVRRFCESRSVDVVLASNGQERTLSLHGEFDGYGDYFTITAHDLEYADVPGGCSVGGLAMAQWSHLAAKKPQWSLRSKQFSGPALAFWDDEARSLEAAPEADCFVMVAREFIFSAGQDWPFDK